MMTILKEREDTYVRVELRMNPLEVHVTAGDDNYVLQPTGENAGREALDMFDHPFAYIAWQTEKG